MKWLKKRQTSEEDSMAPNFAQEHVMKSSTKTNQQFIIDASNEVTLGLQLHDYNIQIKFESLKQN